MSDVPRRALVTGASSGIGRAVAERLLADGWSVTCLVRRDAAPDGALIVRGDVTDPAATERAVAVAAPEGLLHGLVCAAGVPPSGPWDDPEHWRQTLAVDLTAPFDAARLAWPALRAARGSGGAGSAGSAGSGAAAEAARAAGDSAGGGAIVMVGSIVGGLEGSTRSPAYAAAKAGLEGLVRSLAVIGGPAGIRVNAVAPGAIDTPFDPPAFPADDRPDVPLGRMGSPAEVAAVVAFLLSPEAAYVSGAIWTVDGARTVLSPAAAAGAAARAAGRRAGG